MALRCPHCGTEGLREEARFCDTCGFQLNEALFDSGEANPAKTTLLEEEGTTRWLPEAGTIADEDSTRALAEVETPEEDATRWLPETPVEDGATKWMPAEAEETGATRAMPEADDGSTRYMPEAGDEEQPRAAAAAQTVERASPPPQGLLKAGQVLQNRYRLSRMLGKGGFGAAYLAQDLKLKRRCVIKQMLTRGRSPREIAIFRANFEREANLLVELNDPGHPNIPEIYDYFSDDNGNYLVMKYIEGRNLQHVLDQDEGKIPWREAIRYAIDVCNALNYMHTLGHEPIMHRDVKPANILLGKDGRVWLVDFGLAKADPTEAGGGDDPMATRASGSLGYTPLEQWLGQAVPASDVYALGATLHHLVTGVDPLKAYGDEFNIQKIQELHSQFPAIRTIDRKLPQDLEKIIKQATAAAPEQRSTALQLQQQLQVLISGAQEAALFTFKNGKSAKTTGQLVDLCEQNRDEAITYLYNGDFERWFLLINRNDLAQAATQAVEQGKNQKDGLEKFLKLILPNLFARRLRRAGWHLARGSLQFGLSGIVIIILLAIGASYIVSFFIQQSITSIDWDFSTLKVDRENRYTEAFLAEKFREEAGAYFDNQQIQVEIRPPDELELSASWGGFPLNVPVNVRLGDKKPRFHLSEINSIPLFIVANNISDGINRGVDTIFQRGPVDVSRLVVLDGEIVFNIVPSNDPTRPRFATATPLPGPTPTPTPTPTPVPIALVVVFNELNNDVILEIQDQSWDISAHGTQVLEMPPGTYDYTVRYKENGLIAAQGTKTWTLNKAYRLRIGLLNRE